MESPIALPERERTAAATRRMPEPRSKRIALFQYHWDVTSQTANSLIALADAGYALELFLFTSPRCQDLVDFETLRKRTKVEVHQLWTAAPTASSEEERNLTNRRTTFRRRLRSLVRTHVPAVASARSFLSNAYCRYTLRRTMGESLLAPGVVDRALQKMDGKAYRCLIGVEKKGLIWAGLVARKLHLPVLYHSLELYTDDGEYWRVLAPDQFTYNSIRLGERLHHRGAVATIIQDPERAQVLFRDTGVDIATAAIHYVPVSMLGGPYTEPSHYLHDSLRIPRNQKLVLYFGQIWERRYVLELVQAAQKFPDDWLLVLHGPPFEGTVEKIKELDQRRKVVLSLRMVPAEQIHEVVASADVGLLFYSGETHNERLTAFASEKMALYMQCGVPFIAFDYPGFRRLAEDDQCGLVIREFEELSEAIGRILSDREEFGRRAHGAFEKYYNFSHSFAKVIEAIEGL